MRIPLLAACATLTLAGAVAADEEIDSVVLGEVFVTGTFPGPGLWRVSHPDHDRVLWIIAQPPLLPPGMRWHSEEIEQIAAQSQLIVFDGGLGIVPAEKVSVWRMATLAPAVLGARKNPNGERLEEVVPPESYARWREQKRRVIGNDRGIEKWRPLFAAERLRHEAIALFAASAPKSPQGTSLWSTLRRIAKERGIRVVTSSVVIKVPPKELRAAVKRFVASPVKDLDCFDKNVEFVAALADEQRIRTRARAWATGDLETLRRIPALPSFQRACDAAILNSEAAAPYWSGDLQQQLDAAWLTVVEESLASNNSTLASLSIDEVLSLTGRLAELRKKGYVVEEP